MSNVVCQDVFLPWELKKRARWYGDFSMITVNLRQRPEDLPVARHWSLTPCFMPEMYRDYAQKIEQFRARSDDVFVVSQPKCGTTWAQELVWMINNGLDYERAKEVNQDARFPFLEIGSIFPPHCNIELDSVEKCERLASPRHIKSHLPAHLLPTSVWRVKPKIIYVARNPKDAFVSFYHHTRNLNGFLGSFEDCLELFLAGCYNYGPFHSHVLDFWRMRHEPNILFLTYEEMKRNLCATIEKTSQFLGKTLSNSDVHQLTSYLSFASMKTNASVNKAYFCDLMAQFLDLDKTHFSFMRQGETETFRDTLTADQIQRFDEWTTRELQHTDFRY
ncbi:luciferin sulfotransferase-like [Phlebotomus argentipes]|uniref:luciferin sulfotransferase-like n=1 Tax=Phlebotomus argentipes TaxID=94469 RepID=UPI002893601F|nr:luciferin sulfotransferase-like [Phlebotomus argentipes]